MNDEITEKTIGKYEILSIIGRGSMGVVYKAQDPEIGRLVAIKTLRAIHIGEGAGADEALERFRRESKSAGRLRHPNIVTIFEAGRTADGLPFIVMEYIEGSSLSEIIAKRKALPPEEAIHYLAQIGGALDYAHDKGIIHRDIKPGNVLIDNEYRAHLLDFGVAKLGDTSLTPVGTVVGTPSYMSPEQILGNKLDFSTDLFSFAILSFETLTAERPFPGKEFMTVVNSIIYKEPLRFAELGADLPPRLEEVLLKGLAKEKEKRYPSGLDLVQDMARIYGLHIDGNGIVGGYPKTQPSLAPATPPPTDGEAQAPKEPSASEETRQTPEPSSPTQEEPLSASRGKRRLATIFVGTLLLVIVVSSLFLLLKETSLIKREKLSEWLAAIDGVESEDVTEDTLEEQSVSATSPLPEGAVAEMSAASLSLLSDQELIAVLKNALTSSETLQRAIEESAKRAPVLFVPELVSFLEHNDFRIRIAVLKSFSQPSYSREEAVFRSYLAALNDSDFLVRGYSAKLLGALGNPAALPSLEARLGQEREERVKKVFEQAILSLKRLAASEEKATPPVQ